MRIIAYGLGVAALIGCTNSAAQESHAAAHDDDVVKLRLSGVESTRDYDLSGFNRVALSTSDNVEIVQGAAYSVRMTGDSVLFDELEFVVEGGELEIGYREHSARVWFRPEGSPATIFITMPTINGVALSGSGDVTVGHFAVQAFDASIAGSGDIVISSLQADRAELEIAGSGDIIIAGTAADIDVNMAGSGEIKAGDFQAQRLDINIAGSGHVTAYATDQANVRVAGSGSARVRGGARCTQQARGGSGVVDCS